MSLNKKIWCLSNYKSFKSKYDCFYWFSKLTLCIVMAGLRVVIDFPPSRNMRITIFRDRGHISLSFSLAPSFSPFIQWMTMYRLCLARARSLHTRETRCYHVCPNNSVHTFDSSMLPAGRNVGEKRSLGLRYLLIAVTSAPNCTPKPKSPPSLSLSHTFPLISLPFPPRARTTSISISSLLSSYLASYGSQLRVLSRGLLDEPRLVRNSRSFGGGRLRILIREPKYRKIANLHRSK